MSSVYKRGCDRDRRRAPWYLSYIDEVGVRRQKKGFTDKGATEKLAHKLEEEARMAREGIKEKGLPAKEATIDYQLAAYCKFLLQRDVSASRVQAVKAKIEKIAGGCNFTSIDEISTQPIEEYLANRRDAGLSKQTSNHYRQAIHQFCRWLCRKAKLKSNPISEIPKLNAQTDRRHDRRALADDEFQRLIAAAEVGPPVESIVGIDRVIMYILAAWTGYRRGEIGSLTLSSFSLETEHATVTVEARYSKRRRKDLQVLHPEVVDRFRKWLEVRKPTHEKFLFPITAEACGFERKTAKMMRKDLQAARKVWIEEADTEVEKKAREASDYLLYESDAGLFADFHANRHTFITNLAKAGVPAKVTQTLARHSDIRLTMNVYAHTDVSERVLAVFKLPSIAPRGARTGNAETRAATKSNGSDGASNAQPTSEESDEPPANNQRYSSNSGAEHVTLGHSVALNRKSLENLAPHGSRPKALAGQRLAEIDPRGQSLSEVHPSGFEPETFGSVVRI